MLSEEQIVEMVSNYLINKEKGNRHEDKSKIAKLHEKGVDIKLVGGKRNSEYFFIECKKQHKNKSTNSESWLNALGQLVTRMSTSRIIQSGKLKGNINRANNYGLGLHRKAAQTALRRIPKKIANVLNLYIFACCDNGKVIEFTPSQIGERYSDSKFL